MPRQKKKIWEDDNAVKLAFQNSKSMSDIITKLGEPLGSASFRHCKNAAARLSLDIPRFKRDTTAARAVSTKPLKDILVENSSYGNRQYLKKRLIDAGLKKDICESCGTGPEWNGKKLVLQLDHVNGVGDDNRLDNLSVLCPNCHSQTETFGYKPNRIG